MAGPLKIASALLVFSLSMVAFPGASRTATPSAAAQTRPGTEHKEAPLQGVRFDHQAHAVTRKIPCITCHHASKPEKPASAAQQNCVVCHTAVAVAPMKTNLRAAFHNANGTAGLCIHCHRTENTKGLNTPVHCLDCHVKAEA